MTAPGSSERGGRYLGLVALTLLAAVSWAFLVFAIVDRRPLRFPIAERRESARFLAADYDLADKRNRGNLVLVLRVTPLVEEG